MIWWIVTVRMTDGSSVPFAYRSRQEAERVAGDWIIDPAVASVGVRQIEEVEADDYDQRRDDEQSFRDSVL